MTIGDWFYRLRAHGTNLDRWEKEERDLAEQYRELWLRYIALMVCPHCKEPLEPAPLA